MATRRTIPGLLAAGAVLVVVLLASGCGGSSDLATGGGSANAASASREDAQLKFARCLREHGVDVQDPQPGSRGAALGLAGKPGNETKTNEAIKQCEKLVPGGFKEPTAEEREKFQDAALAFARCMRAHGIDVPDPSTQGGGVIMKVPRQNAKFEAAQKECQKLLPQPQEIGS